jgi:anti-sigma-K factor RskA
MLGVGELNEMGCGGFADVAEELALGILTGRERAEALAHLDCCAPCREDVRRLIVAGEELLRLLPAREPPPGFETRVLERLGLAAPGPPGGKRRLGRWPSWGRPGRAHRVLAVAAAALAVTVSVAGG